MQQHDQEQCPRIPEEVRNQIQSSCCQYVLDHACRPHDLTFSIKSKALAAEDTNIQSILFGSPISQHTVSSDRTMEALIAFAWHRCDTKPSVEIADHVVTAANASGVERYIASAAWCLGRTYYRLGDHRHSYSHLQEAYQRFDTLPPGEVESQQLGGRCGIDLVDVARTTLTDKNKAVSLARDVEMKCAALSDNLVHGRSLVSLAAALIQARQMQEALVHLDCARDMLKAVGNIPNLARAYQVTARVHYNEQRLPEAVDAIQEAWKLMESSNSPKEQADISLEFGKFLFSTDRDTEAWKYIEIALMKASYIGNRFQVAKTLEYMGYGYLRRGDDQNAYGAYEAAAKKYLGTISASNEERCKENMIRIKQGNTDAVIGFYTHGYDVDQTLF
jgi:tetratricopeptide (TPR) repeat protein